MSQPFRPPSEGTVPSVQYPGMLPTFGAPRPPLMYATPQMTYQFSPSQQFVPASVIYSSQLPNSQGGVTGPSVPALQGMYPGVPCTQRHEMHRLPLVRPPGGQRMPNVDPSKLIEEQRKLEKERNFQLQQQRLKQFTVAGKKGSLNADNLIDSMFGKPPIKKETNRVEKVKGQNQGTKHPFELTPYQPVTSISSSSTDLMQCSDSKNIKNADVVDSSAKMQKDQKGLDNMIQECSDFSGPQKARTFHKPSVKDLPPSSQQGITFAPSDKARDWSNVQGLDRIFTLPKARFPVWCSKDYVPPLYTQIEALVTDEGSHPPDTNLLYPILISSGLQRELLGYIWELVNQTSPGHLTQEEMYAALALVAVAQCGHPIKSTDILHSLPKCPLPVLQNTTQPAPAASSDSTVKSAEHTESDVSLSTPVTSTATSVRAPSPGSNIFSPSRPTNIKISGTTQSLAAVHPGGSFNIESKVSSWAPFKTPDASSPQSLDDDFDDFKSATPTAVGAHSIIASSSSGPFNIVTVDDDDDFGDFKQAACVPSPLSIPNSEEKKISFSASTALSNKQPSPVDEDLMSPEEDKYSVFRLLQEKEKSNWSVIGLSARNNPNLAESDSNAGFDVSGSPPSEQQNDLPSNVPNSTYIISDQVESNHVGHLASKQQTVTSSLAVAQSDDDFGDFLHADVSSSSVPKIALQSSETFQSDFANFADFSKLRGFPDAPSSSPSWIGGVSPAATSNLSSMVPVSPDDEFGEFTSCHSAHSKSDVSQDFSFHHLKDNISLAESQSVSSLELGVIDGGGHSGESKSSLSRQGSIPSLDLKGVCLEGTDNEDGFGEMQNAVVHISSKTPSPSSEATKPAEEKNPPSILHGFPFQASTLPLTDKYSVIRSEHAKEEDSHISDWTRCIQSCHSILQDATRIFNQMSCSSVCNEVLNSEEGANYVKDVLEVYKVVCRIAVASKAAGKQTDKLLHVIDEVEQAWNTLAVFLTGSSLMPDESSFDFSNGILRADPENNYIACGLCLINVDIRSKAFSKTEEVHILSYGGRQYHSTCANLWVNFVDPLLPALTLPQLL